MRPTAALLLLGFAAATAAHAATATLTLSRDVALWSDVVEVRIQGTGCSGAAEPPLISGTTQEGTVDIFLLGCGPGTAPFSTAIPIGPLYPRQYTVRVFQGPSGVTPPPPFATAPLAVHPDASLGIEVPGAVTDAAPFNLVLTGPVIHNCFGLEGPIVQGNVITASLDINCPFLPHGGPHVFREEFPLGPLPAGEYEVRFFDLTSSSIFGTAPLERLDFVVHDADHGCAPSDSVLCLQDGRFAVEAEWTDFSGNSGQGHALPLAGDANTGLLWFFSPDNVEVTVKVLEGCPVNGHWWVFLSSGSTVGYTVTVTDTVTGTSREYTNDAGEAAPLVTDTQAFDC